MYKNYDIYTAVYLMMLVDAFCLLLMTDELFNKLHINHSAAESKRLWAATMPYTDNNRQEQKTFCTLKVFAERGP